jgi:hypothetical protein
MKVFPKTRAGRTRMISLLIFVLLFSAGCYLVVVAMPGRSHPGPMPALSAEEKETSKRLRNTVRHLAATVGERHVFRPGSLDAAAKFLKSELRQFGLRVRSQAFDAQGQTVENLEVVLPGDQPELGCVVLGAHYDSLVGTPGADDNATGAASLLELSRLLSDHPRRGDLRLVLFVNEEPPFFQTDLMGSLVYARALASQGIKVRGMLSLESMGYFDDTRGSQKYPFPFSLFYPGKGDFIGFVGNISSRSLVRRSIKVFRENAAFPSEGVAAPSFIPGIGWSDHWSFWQTGYPAIMITDTAPFRNPNYHRDTDLIESIDFDALARIVHGLVEVVGELDRQSERG